MKKFHNKSILSIYSARIFLLLLYCHRPISANNAEQINKENGIFSINTKDGCLTIKGSSNGDTPSFSLCDSSLGQQFDVIFQEENNGMIFANVRSRSSGKCLDSEGQGVGIGTKIHQWDCFPNLDKQKFAFESLDDKTFRLKQKISNRYLENNGSGLFLGQDNKTDQEKQIFSLKVQSLPPDWQTGFFFQIKNRNSDMCLSISDAQNGSKIFQDYCNNSPKQLFEKLITPNRKFRLRSIFSGKCLDVEGQGKDNGANIHQWDCLRTQSQFVDVKKVDNQHFTFSFQHTKKCFSIKDDSKNREARLHIWDCYPNNESQNFSLINFKPDYKVSDELPKIMWAFWDTGEDKLPIFNKLNIEHWRKLNPGWEVRILNLVDGDKDNFFNILTQAGINPKDYIPKNWDDLEKIAVPYTGLDGGTVKMDHRIVKSDFIRLIILELFGGLYSDTSNVMLVPLEEFFVKKFRNSSASIAGYSLEDYASINSPVIDGKKIEGMENWLIAAKKKCPVIVEWRKAFMRFWETRIKWQHIHTHPMYSDPTFDFGPIHSIAFNYLNQHAALKYVLHHRPDLSTEFLMLDFNPWWFFVKFGSGADDVYKGFTQTPQILQDTANQLFREKQPLLKFSGPSLTTLKDRMKTLDDYKKNPNLLQYLYEF